MAVDFRVFDLRDRVWAREGDDVAAYVRGLHGRFANAIHACTRVYACPEWRRRGERTPALGLHWNDERPALLLGSIGWVAAPALLEAVEAALRHGEAIRVLVFNSDSDLCFEELLAPR